MSEESRCVLAFVASKLGQVVCAVSAKRKGEFFIDTCAVNESAVIQCAQRSQIGARSCAETRKTHNTIKIPSTTIFFVGKNLNLLDH